MTRASFLLIALSLVLPSCKSVSLGGSEDDAGVADAPVGMAQLTAAPPFVDIGAIDVGATSAPVVVTVTNVGTATSGPLIVTASGAGIAASGCSGMTLAPQASCKISITAHKTVAGPISGIVEVSDNPANAKSISVTSINTGGPRLDSQPVQQHPYVGTGAACINYPTSGYRMFPEDPSIQDTNNGEPWPQCPRNCTILTEMSGASPYGPPNQALPAGACDDEGATCGMGANAWCPPCANVGGPYNGYICVCRGHNWHCAEHPIKGANMCGMPTCIDPTAATKPNSDCLKTTWTDTQVCACGVCRDLCDSDAQCPSGRCKLNQVCRFPDNCTDPDKCTAPCRGLCEPSADAGADAPSCSGSNPAERSCRSTTSDCIPSSCTCAADGQWRCTTDCRSLPLCGDGGVDCSGARIDNKQAASAYSEYMRLTNPEVKPTGTYVAEEKTVGNLWETMQAQLFFVTWYAEDGTAGDTKAFLYRNCTFTTPTNDSMFALIDSGVVADGAFYYSWGWGSGIYRSNLGKLAVNGTTLVRTTSPSYFNPSSGPPGLVVSAENGRLVVYRATVLWTKFNEWTNPEPMGFLKDFGDRLAVVDENGKELSTTLP